MKPYFVYRIFVNILQKLFALKHNLETLLSVGSFGRLELWCLAVCQGWELVHVMIFLTNIILGLKEEKKDFGFMMRRGKSNRIWENDLFWVNLLT